MLQRKIIYIINPVSGTGRHKNLRQLVEAKMKGNNIPFFVYFSVADGDYSFLHPVIKNENITDVVIAGGDGTVSQVVGSLINCNVNFGIIPCGSGNGLAYTANIPKKISKALDIIFTGKPVATDGFTVNNKFSCMLSGLGFDAKIAHDFASQSRRGLLTYFRLTLKNFFSGHAFPFKILTAHSQFDMEAFFISIANANQFGNHFTIAPKASLHDGLLDVVIVRKQYKPGMLLQILKQLAGKTRLQKESAIDKNRKLIYFQTERLTIQNPSSALLHIDGEPAETSVEIKIEIMKKCFRLIRP
jgi:diacylglycerol kinase (ATP)